MTKGMKIFLGVGCGFLVVGAIVVVLGILALNYFEKTVGQSMAKHEEAGREYGRTVDQKGCMDEGVRRSKSIKLLDIGDGLALTTFVDGCLEASRPTAGFCDGVPSFWSMKDSEWAVAECRKAGVDGERTACGLIMKRKHQLCSKPL